MPRYMQKVLLTRSFNIQGRWVDNLNRIYDAADEIEAGITGQSWYDDLIESMPEGFERIVKECSVSHISDNNKTWFGFSKDGVVQLERKMS